MQHTIAQVRPPLVTRKPDGTVTHLVVTVPSMIGKEFKASRLEAQPSMVTLGDQVTMVWTLAAPISASAAQKIAGRLATSIGGKAMIGQAVPMPGSIVANRRVMMVSPPSGAPYHVVDGQLTRRAKPVPQPIDPSALTVRLGKADDGSLALWQPGKQVNGFKLVTGSAGSGKTFALKKLATGVHRYGVPVLVFDFHGDLDLDGVQNVLLSSGTDSRLGLNPMELNLADGKQAGLYDQRGALKEMIERAAPLGHNQRNALREAIEAVYTDKGILDNDPATWTRKPPSFSDLLAVIENDGLRAAASELFGHPIFSRSDQLSIEALLTKSHRLDLSKLSDGVRYISAESLLQRIFRALRAKGPIPITPKNDKERFRLFVVIDEAKILTLGGGNILNILFEEARKFGLGMILASQIADHFSDEVRANAATMLVLKPLDIAQAKRNAPNVGVTPELIMTLKGRGDGYYLDRALGGGVRRIMIES
jgi:hypothetical protein